MKNLLLAIALICAASMQAQDPLKLKVEVVETSATEKVYNFITINFVDIIGWQFIMNFDGTKMKFKEIRNAIHPSQTTGNFYEPTPGELRSVWIDTDLQPNNFPDSTVLFQLVFEILQPEGAPLCFLETQENFEFILKDESDFTLTEILISDDCYQGFSIFLGGTSIENTEVSTDSFIKDVFLSTAGTLTFTSPNDQQLHLSLFDLNGKQLISLGEKDYVAGRNTLQCKPITSGVYVIKAVAEDGKESTVKVFAY
jgi:hypothetical protein